ncbi:AbrB/MazE/SpoVT family DNA-binding domain-containing protein [Candidatus Woesearchaeota archaeon]|nr:AbrB/MazE/SpoVT family DNA-binding domain-containing protein [Candidatus Woesearchaeota archaeon]
MHIRRLVKAGQTSHTVSLPKEWISKNNLQKGDTIYIHPKSNTELLISTKTDKQPIEKKEITINVEGKEVDTIQRDITSAYLNNYNTITLLGDDITSKTKAIRKILHDFVALEISEQTSMRIVAKDLLNLQEISLFKTINRMDLIIRTMIDDTISTFDGKKLQESIRFRDYDVNRLYFLASRLLKGSLTNNELAKQLEVDKGNVLSQWYLVVNLENLADYIKNISEISKTRKDKKIKEIVKTIQQNYLDIMKARHKNDKKLADSVIKRRKEIFLQCNKLENQEISSIIKSITTTINNIAKIIIDKE